MVEKKKTKLSPYEQEQIDTAKKVLEFKIACESNIVSCIYKQPDLIFLYNLQLNDFNENMWRVYYEIAHGILIDEQKSVLDDITIGMYLEKHSKLRAKYQDYGGYGTILSATEYIHIDNFNGYIKELRKWKAVIQLIKTGFPVKDKLSNFVDMTAENIYNEYSAFLNDTFVNIDSDVKSYDICDGIDELIESLDEGFAMGLEFYDMPMLTKETGGQYLGAITLLGGVSNAGKSTVARSTTIPSIIKNKERLVIMVNEDSVAKWQRELIIWICNNILRYDVQKHTLRDGHFTPEAKGKFYEAAQWLKEQTKNHLITIIPFQQYKTDKAIKEIRKYAALNVKYFILDTFKMDAGRVSSDSWLQMQQAMVDIKDTIKTESLNVHILITFQLEKGSSVMRYYTQNNIGMAKNIVDVASTCIMIRDVLEDEYEDGSNHIEVKRLEGKNGNTKIPEKLHKDKRYQIFFIVKNQEGAANNYQIVAEHDKSRNIIKEIGICNITPNW